MMWRFVFILSVGSMFGFQTQVAASEPICVSCEVTALKNDIQTGALPAAIERLKALKEQYPARREPVLLLARAYNADENMFWAFNVLYQWLELNPDDCEAISHLAWYHIGSGNLDDARQWLNTDGCPNSDAMKTRWQLMLAAMASVENDTEPAVEKGLEEAYPEDRVLWDSYWKRANAGRTAPLEFELKTQVGYSSNGVAGSPQDAAAESEDSALGKLELRAQFVIPTRKQVRPFLEWNERLLGLADEAVADYSYVDSSLRSGLFLGDRYPVRLSYLGNLLLLADSQQRRFYETHRFEIDYGSKGGLLLLAGVGKRYFMQNGRTRRELDAGVGASRRLNRWMVPLLVLNGKVYDAIGEAYDQLGMGLLAVVNTQLPATMHLRTGISETVDYFPHSGGELGRDAFGTAAKRKDFTVRFFNEWWLPSLDNLDWGVRYEWNHRNSTANDAGTQNFEYDEHKVLFQLRVVKKMNPSAPRLVKEDDHVPLQYGLSVEDDDGLENTASEIAEMLRQDEAARAASSCIE
ncbi:MAG: hypothetical protein JXX29_10490 [Deltaproteobacteria bacterium]|nr:hypothetical protein [Deltaproteobacteria bacterium]MBN2672095.1 hypothetical protein [Deltaproteobacteria bacterium]